MAAVQNREIEAVTRKEMPQGERSPEEAILKVIAAMVKQRRESIGLFLQGTAGSNRREGGESEIVVLDRYLPKSALRGGDRGGRARGDRGNRRQGFRPTWDAS